MKEFENERRDWVIVAVILLLGLLCVFLAGGWAIRFSRNWKVDADVGSHLDPNSEALTRPSGFVEVIDSAIQTPPVWMDSFLTEGAVFPTRTRLTSTPLPLATFTRVMPTATKFLAATATNTLIYFPPTYAATSDPTNTKIPKTKPAATPTNTSVPLFTATNTPITPTPSADLQITKTDNAADYAPGISVQYVIAASNPFGPNGVNGAIVSDIFSSNLNSITWTCVGSGGASCATSGSGNINDSTVNLPVGSSVAYTVNATVIGSPSGPLINTATVNIPAGITDPNSSNNSATDTDSLIIANPIPAGSIGNIPAGSYSDYRFGTPLVVGSGSYLVYYPQNSAPPPNLEMDVVVLQISDGRNWYTVFDWGDGAPDTNTDINPADCPSETDNCLITVPPTNPPGITINLNGVVPNGTYPYIRIISPSSPPDIDGGINVDTIQILP